MSRSPARRAAPPATATPRAVERRQALKTSLIDAAEQTIAGEGWTGINARRLALEVGCALGAIYNVFPDLDAIVYEVNSRTLGLLERFVAKRTAAAGAAGPVDVLVAMSVAYLDFAIANQPRWRALMEHRSAPSSTVPPDYLAEQARIFMLVEQPVAMLRPDFTAEERAVFSRTMFSAVHGVVSLGLDKKLVSLPVAVLGDQLRTLIRLLGRALQESGVESGARAAARAKSPRRRSA